MKQWLVTMKITVGDNWIADGFDLSEHKQQLEDAARSICGYDMLPYAYENEIRIETIITKFKPEKHDTTTND